MRPLAHQDLKKFSYSKNHSKLITPHSTTSKMPKSKRAKVVHLTKVDKKGKELTFKLFANVRESLDQYQVRADSPP